MVGLDIKVFEGQPINFKPSIANAISLLVNFFYINGINLKARKLI